MVSRAQKFVEFLVGISLQYGSKLFPEKFLTDRVRRKEGVGGKCMVSALRHQRKSRSIF